MDFVSFVFRRKYLIFSVFGILAVLGILGYFTLPKKLFPDIERPHVVIITRYPGADAENVATYVTIPIEKRVQTIALVRRITSTSMDGVSSVDVEFEYGKDPDAAVVDVINELKKVRFPQGVKPPMVFKKTSSTPPVIVIGVYPKEGSKFSLADIREIAENELKDKFLRLPHVRNVDVFGGYKKEVRIEVNPKKLNEYGLSLLDVFRVISANNQNVPIGVLISPDSQITVKLLGQAKHVEKLKNLFITPNLKLSDIAKIKFGYADPRSYFFTNGRKALALAVHRLEGGDYLKTIEEVEKLLKELKKEYPELEFTVSDTLKEITLTSFYNMIEVLRDAVVYTLIVMFLFLANTNLTLGVVFSIPFVFVGSVGVMKLLGIEFNIVSETGLILALGMLADDAVVVLENIERHISELGENVKTAVIEGTREVMFAVASGSLAITFVLIPLLFVGGYPQKIFQFLVGTLIIAIWVSWFVSVTFLPLFASFIYRKGEVKRNKLDKFVEKFIIPLIVNPFRNLYVALVKNVTQRPKTIPLYMIAIMAIFVLSARVVVPLLGKDTMPPMDTGVLVGSIQLDSTLSHHEVKNIGKRIIEILESERNKGMKRYYLAFGTEPGVITIGGGGNLQNARLVVSYVDRFHRKENIWQIEQRLMKEISQIPGVKFVNLMAQGATPLSSIKATVDTVIVGDDYRELFKYGERLFHEYFKVKGGSSVELSWQLDNLEVRFIPNFANLNYYRTSLIDIARQLSVALNGRVSSSFLVPNEVPIGVKVQLVGSARETLDDLKNLLIKTPEGFVPLTQLGKLEASPNTPLITRENLKYSIDVMLYKDTAPSSFVIDQAHRINEKLKSELPPGFELRDMGEIGIMTEALSKMSKAFLVGAIFAYFVLVVAFESLSAPVAIILSIPLAAVGSMWFLLFANQHRCAPAMMGLILVSGIIIRNAILLIDFAENYVKEYGNLKEALVEAVRVRTRPVLMTAFATIAGLVPIALQKAVGLERLAPLAWVAIGGLLVGTFLTLVYVPIFYMLVYRLRKLFF